VKEQPEIREVMLGYHVACHLHEVQIAAFMQATAVGA
jgi:hypothetical protein